MQLFLGMTHWLTLPTSFLTRRDSLFGEILVNKLLLLADELWHRLAYCYCYRYMVQDLA